MIHGSCVNMLKRWNKYNVAKQEIKVVSDARAWVKLL